MSETKFLISLPFTKVDKEKRIVSGYATTDAIDKQGEQVDYDASKEAFKDWSGNIREMHSPNAVGKAVSWTPDDEKRGVKVDAYISKGAEDTWQKILDGTLKAFSIGGQTVNKTAQIIKDDKGGSRNVTKITKYRLTELSLVDNPANPDASFTLVKMAGDTPTQTELVEDIRKVMVSESSDTLENEVKEHRSKADSLAKKVLSTEELQKLDSENWGVIRKYEKDGAQYIERLLPMPDKVHAVRALSVMDSYSLNKEEQDRVHDLAKNILGSDYEIYALNTTKGVEIKKMNKEILDEIKSLSKKVEELEAKFAKVNIEGAKSADPTQIQTQEEGNVAPKKADDKEVKGDTEGKVPAEGEKHSLDEASKADPKQIQTQEEGNVAPVKKEAGIPEAKKAIPTLKTQEEGNVAPVKKAKAPKEGSDAEEAMETKEEEAAEVTEGKDVKKAKNPATSSIKTQEDKDVPPVKKGEIVKETKKEISKSTDELILETLKALSKRLDKIESTPLPRKYATVEKRYAGSETDVASGLEADMSKCLELRKQEQSGKKLTADELLFIEKTLAKSIDSKFNKNL